MLTARASRRLEVAAVLAVIALLGLLAAPLPFTGDQALFAAGARQLARGDVLYRDFWDVKQPGIYAFYRRRRLAVRVQRGGVASLRARLPARVRGRARGHPARPVHAPLDRSAGAAPRARDLLHDHRAVAAGPGREPARVPAVPHAVVRGPRAARRPGPDGLAAASRVRGRARARAQARAAPRRGRDLAGRRLAARAGDARSPRARPRVRGDRGRDRRRGGRPDRGGRRVPRGQRPARDRPLDLLHRVVESHGDRGPAALAADRRPGEDRGAVGRSRSPSPPSGS